MGDDRTTIAVQRYLDELAKLDGEAPVGPVVHALIARSAERLQSLCGAMLYRAYPRLTKPPMNLQAEEMLGAVVDRLLKALRDVRPKTVREFFALANQHLRWELNDLARRLDAQTASLGPFDGCVAAPEVSGSQLGVDARRILQAIERLPESEREVFSLVRIQGMSQVEVAEVLDISTKTVQRRLNRGLMLLADELSDLVPGFASPAKA